MKIKSIAFLIFCILLIYPVIADNTNTTVAIATNPTQVPTGFVPTPTLAVTSTPTPIIPYHPYIHQGDSVYINDTIDISGVVPPYPELAYWNGYDMYDSNASYIVKIPDTLNAYYSFYLDPSIFLTRTGKWYKYDPNVGFEPNGNNLAFVVYPQSYKNSTLRYSNGSVFNLTQYIVGNYSSSSGPITPPVEIKHVSDYLLAIGDPFIITTNETTNLWLFGRINQLADYQSFNSTQINVSPSVISGFEPGAYTLMMQTIRNGSTNFTVKYDNQNSAIKWFDPTTFTIQGLSTLGLSPQVFLQKFEQIIPETYDNFELHNLTLQSPSIDIQSISEMMSNSNATINQAGVTEYNTNISFIEVKGYTNVKIGSIIRFILDQNEQTDKTIKAYTSTAVVGGTGNPGDMRWFDIAIPVDKYNMATGPHTITGYTNLSTGGTTAMFDIYSAPAGTYIPPATVRYVAGQYGEQEFIPTPTPVTVIKTIPVPGPTQTVIVTITPSEDEIKAQQQIVIVQEEKTWALRIIIGAIVIFGIWYLISLYLRRRELD